MRSFKLIYVLRTSDCKVPDGFDWIGRSRYAWSGSVASSWNRCRTFAGCSCRWSWHRRGPRSNSATFAPMSATCLWWSPYPKSWWGRSFLERLQLSAWSYGKLGLHLVGGQQERSQTHVPSNHLKQSWFPVSWSPRSFRPASARRWKEPWCHTSPSLRTGRQSSSFLPSSPWKFSYSFCITNTITLSNKSHSRKTQF